MKEPVKTHRYIVGVLQARKNPKRRRCRRIWPWKGECHHYSTRHAFGRYIARCKQENREGRYQSDRYYRLRKETL